MVYAQIRNHALENHIRVIDSVKARGVTAGLTLALNRARRDLVDALQVREEKRLELVEEYAAREDGEKVVENDRIRIEEDRLEEFGGAVNELFNAHAEVHGVFRDHLESQPDTVLLRSIELDDGTELDEGSFLENLLVERPRS